MAHDQKIRLDHDEIEQWSHRSDAIRDDYNEVLKLLDDVVAEVTAEASKYTENGQPAPIYHNTVEQTKVAVGHLKQQIVKHQENMTKDSHSVLEYSQKVKDEAAESGNRVAGANTDITI